MNQSKQTFITAFALFSLFFGAGNLILPPFLGYNAGENWFWVTIGFAISAVIIPILAIYGHARIQGTMLDFANKVSPGFAMFYSVVVYIISISLPSPRTASVTYEMAIEPYFEVSSLLLSSIYFAVVLVFVLNRTRILSVIGKFLTPLIIVILLSIICIGLFGNTAPMREAVEGISVIGGIIEGYQTFDAIGGVLVGGVIVISFALQGTYDYEAKKKMMGRAGLYAGIGLFIIYGGLIALGAFYSNEITTSSRSEYLTYLSSETLGSIGTSFLAVLVSLACFTTAVGIVTGTADFVKGLFKDSQKAYLITAILGCLIGVVVGQFDIHYIIDLAVPALMFIYPITISLILLNVLPKQWTNKLVFRGVTIVVFLFSLPDVLKEIISDNRIIPYQKFIPDALIESSKSTIGVFETYIPFAKDGMGWVLPALVIFVLLNIRNFKAR
ncbi:MAG: branched-chain amino acid transport system II carrier protein [Flavobacteriaceae bacterium]|nr:branched-chain amino acid transport system II carrier protein [Flavobacteriaceae bacterium]